MVLQCDIGPILKYGCEAWTGVEQIQRRLDAKEMIMVFEDSATNCMVRKEQSSLKGSANNMCSYQLNKKSAKKIFRPCDEKSENATLDNTETIEGNDGRLRLRENVAEGLEQRLYSTNMTEMLREMEENDGLRNMIANATRQCST